MSGWTFYDFIEPSGRNAFREWRSSLPDEAQAFIEARILQMRGLRRWSDKWASKYRGAEGIIELRVTFNKVQYRPLGTHAPNFSFILLGGGIEKGKIPPSVIAAVERRRVSWQQGNGYVREHRVD